MKDRALAMRYSKALFELAAQEKLELKVESDLQNFKVILDQNPSLSLFLQNPVVTFDKKKEMLAQVAPSSIVPISNLVIHFITLLIARGRFGMIGLMLEAYHELLNTSQHFEEVTITTAKPLKRELKAQLEKLLEEKIGEKIVADMKVDSNLIGGIQVQIRNRLLDGSVKSKLDELSRQLLAV